ncbi:Unknown protein, partial [Striga hermonthica]
DREKVLQGGPYSIYGRRLIIKVLPNLFQFGEDDIETVPVWINLPLLSWNCWSTNALSKIAFCVGSPITTDKLTATRDRCNYARILVELDISKERVYSIPVKSKGKFMFEQKVEYEYVPQYCNHCKYIGHSTSNCGKHKAHLEKIAEGKKPVEETGTMVTTKVAVGPKENLQQSKKGENTNKEHGERHKTKEVEVVEENQNKGDQEKKGNGDCNTRKEVVTSNAGSSSSPTGDFEVHENPHPDNEDNFFQVVGKYNKILTRSGAASKVAETTGQYSKLKDKPSGRRDGGPPCLGCSSGTSMLSSNRRRELKGRESLTGTPWTFWKFAAPWDFRTSPQAVSTTLGPTIMFGRNLIEQWWTLNGRMPAYSR